MTHAYPLEIPSGLRNDVDFFPFCCTKNRCLRCTTCLTPQFWKNLVTKNHCLIYSPSSNSYSAARFTVDETGIIIYVRRDAFRFMCEEWRIHVTMRNVTHQYIYARRDSFIYGTWRLPVCNVMYSYMERDSFKYGTWRIFMCDVTHSYMGLDAFVCEMSRVHAWDVTHSHMPFQVLLCATWHFHTWDWTPSHVQRDSHISNLTPFYVRRDSFVYLTWLFLTCDVIHSYIRRDSFSYGPPCLMGWLRLVGSSKS